MKSLGIFKNLCNKVLKPSGKIVGRKILNNLGVALQITIYLGTAAATLNSAPILRVAVEAVKFGATGKVVQFGS